MKSQGKLTVINIADPNIKNVIYNDVPKQRSQ